MIEIKQGETNYIEIAVSGKFQSVDFDQLEKVVDKLQKS